MTLLEEAAVFWRWSTNGVGEPAAPPKLTKAGGWEVRRSEVQLCRIGATRVSLRQASTVRCQPSSKPRKVPFPSVALANSAKSKLAMLRLAETSVNPPRRKPERPPGLVREIHGSLFIQQCLDLHVGEARLADIRGMRVLASRVEGGSNRVPGSVVTEVDLVSTVLALHHTSA